MSTYLSRKWLFWLLIGAGFVIFLHAIKAILLPFIAGLLIAYFLDPAADRLEKLKLSRTGSTVIILLLFFGVMTVALSLLIPSLITQSEGLLRALPKYIEHYQALLQEKLSLLLAQFSDAELEQAKDAVAGGSQHVNVSKIAKGVVGSGFAIVNLASLIVITPIVSFYLLRDWDRILRKIDSLLPRAHAETIREQATLIDQTISGYVRGVFNVMLVLGCFYIVGLSFVGLDFAIIIGILGGIAIIVPYVGTIVSGGAAVGMAYLQFDSWEPVAITLAIFTAGQILEGYVLTPKLVGDKIGLHPLWLIFGMLCGAALFGFVGILLAIPVTAIIGVLTRFSILQYKASDYYQAQ